MLTYLRTINWALFRIGSCITLVAITLLTGADAILRYLAGTPIYGAYDLVGVGLLMTIIVALPDSLRTGCHVRMDILYDHYGPRMRLAVDTISHLGALAFAILVAWQAFRNVPHYARSGEATVTLGLPIWPFTLMIGLSCTMFCLSIIGETLSPQPGKDDET